MHRAEIIAVGTELLSFSRPETNSLFLTYQLAKLGISVVRKFTVGDRNQHIQQALKLALGASDFIFLTGGLGPTNDDRTREAVAAALGLPLSEDPELLDRLRRHRDRLGLPLSSNYRRQASLPEGAETLPNANGSAPGLLIRWKKAMVFLLPGPPHEMEPMAIMEVLPRILKNRSVAFQPVELLKTAGEIESRLDERIEDIYREYSDIETTLLSSQGIIRIFFCWNGLDDTTLARTRLSEIKDRVRERLGDSVFSDGDVELEEATGSMLRNRGLTLAVAESCTGGLLGAVLTRAAGAADYFLGGVICYSNRLKVQLAGVDPELLARSGAVSEQVALQMASGVRRLLNADIGLSITGVAGPTGGTDEKPVGLVFVGLAMETGVEVRKLQLSGDRQTIRARAANLAIDLLRRSLL
ncbi:MAG TPA: competence/damage-inducible protein A [Acidobacteriota bacterium]|nr:competence/damage-inducible protein A [Acidobacteriota bacterium]